MSDSVPLLTFPARGVALLQLNRPTAANRLQPEDLDQLLVHIDRCERDVDVNALVFTGTGLHFSSGFDLEALSAGLRATGPAVRDDVAFSNLADRLESSRLISVAAINGSVIGGATDLVLACDLRVGVPAARMQMPAARFGLPLYAGALQRYVTRFGLDIAKRLVLTAQAIESAEMHQIGCLSEVVDAAELLPRSLELAALIAAMPAEPMAAMKQVLNASATGRGTDSQQHDALSAALRPAEVADRIASLRSLRREQKPGVS